MTQTEALQEARRRNWRKPYAYHYSSLHAPKDGAFEVGEHVETGLGEIMRPRGNGASWEEAFAVAGEKEI